MLESQGAGHLLSHSTIETLPTNTGSYIQYNRVGGLLLPLIPQLGYSQKHRILHILYQSWGVITRHKHYIRVWGLYPSHSTIGILPTNTGSYTLYLSCGVILYHSTIEILPTSTGSYTHYLRVGGYYPSYTTIGILPTNTGSYTQYNRVWGFIPLSFHH